MTSTTSTPLATRRPAPGQPTTAPLVLVVEDDLVTRDFLVEALADEGYAAETATNGAAALERLAAAPPSAARQRARPVAVLLDLTLPVMGGWAFLRAYGERCHAGRLDPVPVGVLTGQPLTSQRRARLESFGVPVQVLAKPFTIEALTTLLADLHRHSVSRTRS